MYQYDTIIDALKDELTDLVDPSIPLSEGGTGEAIYGAVSIGQPSNLSLYNGPLAVIVFGSKESKTGINNQGRKAIITGAIATFIPGQNEDSVKKCLHYCDIVEYALEDNPTLLDMKGVRIQPLKQGKTQEWTSVNVSGNTKNPKICIAGGTRFIITASRVKPTE